MIKKIIVGLCLLISITTFAQQGTASPYSYYGLGDVKFKGTVENRSMGSLSVFPDSIHMNLQNPAHFASLKRTNFTFGGTSAHTKMESGTESENSTRTSIDYFAVALPFKKFAVSFGAIPYTSVGYKIQQDITKYEGLGGINKVYLAFGYQLTKKINFGADFQYNFGNIQATNLHYAYDIQYGTKEFNRSNIGGYNFDFGLTYQTKLNSKLSLFSSLLYSPQANLNLTNTRYIQIVQALTTGTQRVIDQQNITVPNTEVKLPTKIGFGTGFGQMRKWVVGAEVTYIENSVLSNRTPDITGNSFENTMRYSIGGYFIPNYSAYSGYYKRVVYRGGFRYENTGLVLQNKSIEDYAATIGLGLPIAGTFSNVNIGLELGRRGTTANNLIRENYLNLSVSLSLSDRWFVKRQIN